MDSRERLLKAVENSACLTRRQMSDYIQQKLYPEELYVVEMHLNECPFCNDAVEGFSKSQENFLLLDALELPQLPQQKTTPVSSLKSTEKEKTKTGDRPADKNHADAPPNSGSRTTSNPFANEKKQHNAWGKIGIAAGILLGIGLLGYFQFNKKEHNNVIVADNINNPTTNNTVAEEETLAQATMAPPAATHTEDSIINQEYGTSRSSTVAVKIPDSAASSVATVASDSLSNKSLAVVHTIDAKPPQTNVKIAADPAKRASQSATEKEISSKAMAAAAKSKVEEEAPSKDVKKTEEKLIKAPQPIERKKEKTEPAKENPKTKADKKMVIEEEAPKPSNTLADYKKGVDLYKKGQYGAALLYLHSTIADKDNPNRKQALLFAAACQEELGNSKKATQLRRQAKQIK